MLIKSSNRMLSPKISMIVTIARCVLDAPDYNKRRDFSQRQEIEDAGTFSNQETPPLPSTGVELMVVIGR
jgi:hypothetical protein